MNLNEQEIELIGELIYLRPLSAEDISENYLSWLNNQDTMRFSNQRFKKHTYKSCLAYIDSFESSENLLFGIFIKTNKRMVGTINAYVKTNHQTADMGILVGDQAYSGKGIGLDAWRTLLEYLLNVKKTRKVTGGTLRCNIGMIKIMKELVYTKKRPKLDKK